MSVEQAQYSSKFSEIIQNLIKESKGELQDSMKISLKTGKVN